MTSLFFNSEYYQVLNAAHLSTLEWVALGTTSDTNLLKVFTWQQSWWELNSDLWVTGSRPYHYATEPHIHTFSMIECSCLYGCIYSFGSSKYLIEFIFYTEWAKRLHPKGTPRLLIHDRNISIFIVIVYEHIILANIMHSDTNLLCQVFEFEGENPFRYI